MSLFNEFWGFLRERKRYWLLPIIIAVIVVGALLFLAGEWADVPFVYQLF
jgi:hypothetical protein